MSFGEHMHTFLLGLPDSEIILGHIEKVHSNLLNAAQDYLKGPMDTPFIRNPWNFQSGPILVSNRD